MHLLIGLFLASATHAQPQPDFSGIVADKDSLVVSWDSTNPTHVVEMTAALTNTYIVISPVVSGRSLRIPRTATNSMAFFRVRAVCKIDISDPQLTQALRDALDNNTVSTKGLYDVDLLDVAELNASALALSSIAGIENASHLAVLDLGYTNWNCRNQISDVSCLSTLTNLTDLNLNGNIIRDVSPLANLARLETLELGWNQIHDISPLSNLHHLRRLRLTHNLVTNIAPICELQNLRSLDLSENPIADISSLENLHNIDELVVANNNIMNLAFVTNMEHLNVLYVSWNPIESLEPLAAMHSLTKIYMYDVNISDLGPLLENASAGGLKNCSLNIHGMPLSQFAITNQIPRLKNMGVTVIY